MSTVKHGWYDYSGGYYSDLFINGVEVASVSLKYEGVQTGSNVGDFHYVENVTEWPVIAHFDDIEKGKKIIFEVFS